MQEVEPVEKVQGEEVWVEKGKEINWVKKGKVSKVKDQGQCGSCWAFSTTGSFESFLAIRNKLDLNGGVLELSEQELVDCSGEYGNYGCNGGLMSAAYKYIAKSSLHSEEAYPYKGYEQDCNASRATGDTQTVKNVRELSNYDTKDLSEWLEKGPVSIAIGVSYDFQAYTGGVYTGEGCKYTGLNHGVLLVGQKANYFIVKNSWGTSWGEKGYIRMKNISGSGACHMANQMDVQPVD